MRRLILAAVFVLVASIAQAQAVNPKFIEFTSADHAIVTRYELGYFAIGATAPVQTVSIPKSEFTAQADSYLRTALPRPVFGNFVLKARAFAPAVGGGEVDSGWSTDQTLPFVLSPMAPVGLRATQ